MWGQRWGQMIWGAGAAVPSGGLGWTVVLAVGLVVIGLRFVKRGGRSRAAGVAVLALAFVLPVSVALAQVPFAFTNGQVADAVQVNADFAYLNNSAKTYVNGASSFGVTSLSQAGVGVATLSLPAGSYVLNAKWRYQQQSGTTTTDSAACALYGPMVGIVPQQIPSDDASEAQVPPGGHRIDGYTVGQAIIAAGDAPFTVTLGCYGSTTTSVANPQLVAVATTALVTQ